MSTYERIGNMGTGEQVIRGGVGLILAAAVVAIPGLSPAVLAGLAMVLIYVGFTAATGWDPVYAVAQTLRRQGAIEAGEVKPFRARRARVPGEHKKAA